MADPSTWADVQLTLFDQCDAADRPAWCWVCESERAAPVLCGPGRLHIRGIIMRDRKILDQLEKRADAALAWFERTRSDDAADGWAAAIRAVCLERTLRLSADRVAARAQAEELARRAERAAAEAREAARIAAEAARVAGVA